MPSDRVTVTLPREVVLAMDREESNRSRFVLRAVTRELDRRQIDRLEQSLRNPHPETSSLNESGFASWAAGLADDASDLVEPGAGEPIRWSADRGWVGAKS